MLSFRPLGIDFAFCANGCLWLSVRGRRWRTGRDGRFRRSLLVDDLPNLVQFLFNSRFRALNAGLAQIDRVSEQRTTCMDALGVTAFFQVDSFVLQKLADVFVKLVFLYWIHN